MKSTTPHASSGYDLTLAKVKTVKGHYLSMIILYLLGIAIALGFVFWQSYSYPEFHLDKLISKADLIFETNRIHVYFLTPPYAAELKYAKPASLQTKEEWIERIGSLNHTKNLLEKEITKVETHLHNWKLPLRDINIFLAPVEFQEDQNFHVGAYVIPYINVVGVKLAQNQHIFISTNSDPHGILHLSHEIGHLVWARYIEDTPWEEEWRTIRGLEESFYQKNSWHNSHTEVFAEDFSQLIAGDYFYPPGLKTLNKTYARELTPEQFQDFSFFLSKIGNGLIVEKTN